MFPQVRLHLLAICLEISSFFLLWVRVRRLGCGLVLFLNHLSSFSWGCTCVSCLIQFPEPTVN